MLNYLKTAGLAIIALIPVLAYWAGKREGDKRAKKAEAKAEQAVEQVQFEQENEALEEAEIIKAKQEVKDNVDSRQDSDGSFTKSDF